MLEFLLSTITEALGGVLDFILTWFLDLMVLDVNRINVDFPALFAGYRFFQGIAIGLIFLIAVVHLYSFHTGKESSQDRPLGILVRSAMSAFLVWFGAYFLELLIQLAQFSYKAMIDMDTIALKSLSGNIDMSLSSVLSVLWMDAAAIAVSPIVVIIVNLLILGLIGYNLLKLMIEVCERYLMVLILFYTCPLAFSTLATRSTSTIFQKWFGMFCGQCALMTLSAWFMNLILSGFTMPYFEGSGYALRLLLTLALCKIAQRADTYLQQLGIGVALTGGNLLGETMATISLIQGKLGGHSSGGSKTSSVLGEQEGTMSRVGGILGGVSNMAQKGYHQYKEGAKPEEYGSQAFSNFDEGFMGKDPFFKAARKKVQPDYNPKSEQGKKMAEASVYGSQIFNERRNANPEKYMSPKGAGGENSPIYSDVAVRAAEAKKTIDQYTAMKRTMDGVGTFVRGGDNKIHLDQSGKNAGLFYKDNIGNEENEATNNDKDLKPYDFEKMNIIEGPDDRVGDFLANNYSNFANDQEMNQIAIETLNNSSHAVAEQIVSNPYTDALVDNDELGDAVIKKMFGEANVTGQTGGSFHGVKINSTASGGRLVSAVYKNKNGELSTYDIMDEKTREKAGIDDEEAKAAGFRFGMKSKSDLSQMNCIKSPTTGAKWYALRKETKSERFMGTPKAATDNTSKKSGKEK